jgi:hypothetical protein
MKTLNKLTSARFVLTVLFATCLLPVTHAQSVFKGKFSLQEQVRWARAVLPAGDYTVTVTSTRMPNVATVRSADGKRAVFVVAKVHDNVQLWENFLSLSGAVGQREVRSLNLAGPGISLIYDHAAAPSRELEVAEVPVVPVTLAKK